MRRMILLWMALIFLGAALLLGCGVPGIGGGGESGGETGGTTKQFKVWYTNIPGTYRDQLLIGYKVYQTDGSSLTEVDSNDEVYSWSVDSTRFAFHDAWYTRVNGEEVVVTLMGDGTNPYLCVLRGSDLGRGLTLDPSSNSHCYQLSISDTTEFNDQLRVNVSESDNAVIVAFQNDTQSFFYKVVLDGSEPESITLTMPIGGLVRDIFVGFAGGPSVPSYPWIVRYNGSGFDDLSESFSVEFPVDRTNVVGFAIGGLDSSGKVGLITQDRDQNIYFSVCDYYGLGLSNCSYERILGGPAIYLRKSAVYNIGDGYMVAIYRRGFSISVISYDLWGNITLVGSNSIDPMTFTYVEGL